MTTLSSKKTLAGIFDTDRLHHAYLIEGEVTVLVPELNQLLEKKFRMKIAGNPDFQHLRFESMGVDDARALREAVANKAFGAESDRKIFLIETATITNEAQNALLKILEEPTAGTHFFIIMPSRWLLLPTVRSRLQIVSVGPNAEKETDIRIGETVINIADFIKAKTVQRLALLAPILEEKDKTAALALVDGLIRRVRQPGVSEKNHAALRELLHIRQYLNDRSASLKLLLEHLAIVVPLL